MAQGLVSSERLHGMKREEVDRLLGDANGSYTAPEAPFDQQSAWMLDRPQDLFVPLPPELVVIYRDGRVARAWIDPGILD